MKLWLCERSARGDGALIIAANTYEEVIKIYKKKEGDCPYTVNEMPIKKGVLYDDRPECKGCE